MPRRLRGMGGVEESAPTAPGGSYGHPRGMSTAGRKPKPGAMCGVRLPRQPPGGIRQQKGGGVTHRMASGVVECKLLTQHP